MTTRDTRHLVGVQPNYCSVKKVINYIKFLHPFNSSGSGGEMSLNQVRIMRMPAVHLVYSLVKSQEECSKEEIMSEANSECMPTREKSSQAVITRILDGDYKCRGCGQCNNTTRQTWFSHPHTASKIKKRKTTTVISCHTKGVIFLPTCPFGKGHGGKTPREQNIAAYFIEMNHPASYLKYMGTEKLCLSKTEGDLESREAFWISTEHFKYKRVK